MTDASDVVQVAQATQEHEAIAALEARLNARGVGPSLGRIGRSIIGRTEPGVNDYILSTIKTLDEQLKSVSAELAQTRADLAAARQADVEGQLASQGEIEALKIALEKAVDGSQSADLKLEENVSARLKALKDEAGESTNNLTRLMATQHTELTAAHEQGVLQARADLTAQSAAVLKQEQTHRAAALLDITQRLEAQASEAVQAQETLSAAFMSQLSTAQKAQTTSLTAMSDVIEQAKSATMKEAAALNGALQNEIKSRDAANALLRSDLAAQATEAVRAQDALSASFASQISATEKTQAANLTALSAVVQQSNAATTKEAAALKDALHSETKSREEGNALLRSDLLAQASEAVRAKDALSASFASQIGASEQAQKASLTALSVVVEQTHAATMKEAAAHQNALQSEIKSREEAFAHLQSELAAQASEAARAQDALGASFISQLSASEQAQKANLTALSTVVEQTKSATMTEVDALRSALQSEVKSREETIANLQSALAAQVTEVARAQDALSASFASQLKASDASQLTKLNELSALHLVAVSAIAAETKHREQSIGEVKSALEVQAVDAKSVNSQATKALEGVSSALASLQGDVTKQTRDVSQKFELSEKRTAAFEATLANLESAFANKSDEIATALGAIADDLSATKTKLGALDGALEQASRHHEASHSDLQKNLADIMTELGNTGSKIARIEEDATLLATKAQTLTAKVEDVDGHVKSIEGSTQDKAVSIDHMFGQIRSEVQQAIGRLGSLEAETQTTVGQAVAEQLSGLLDRTNAFETKITMIGEIADSTKTGMTDLSQRTAMLGVMETNVDYLLKQSTEINNSVNSVEVTTSGFLASISNVNARLDYFMGQVQTMSMDLFRMRNAMGVKLNEQIDGYSIVDRLQNVALYGRATSADLQVRAGLRAKPIQPVRTPAISVDEIWAQFKKRAPLNVDLFRQAFEVGAASYVGFPSGSCSITGAPLAHEFARFIAPYLVNSRTTLDVGCGPQECPIYLEIADPDSLHGVDILAPYEPHSFPFVQTAGEFLPWEDNSFDLLVSGGALDHYYLLDDGMDEAWRVLKPGGHYVGNITLFDDAPPYDPYTAKMESYDSEHLYHINMAWFEPFMRERGFELVELMVFHLPFIYGIMSFKKVDKPVRQKLAAPNEASQAKAKSKSKTGSKA